MELKTCKSCGTEKEITNFRMRTNGYLRHQCKKCEVEYTKRFRKKRSQVNKKTREEKQHKKQNEIINSYVGIEFGPFIVTKYDGYRVQSNSKYPRHFFFKKCKFCNKETILSKSGIDNYIKHKRTCNNCKEAYNLNTVQKKCSSCKIMKDATEENFTKQKNRVFGLSYYCRNCHLIKSRKSRESEEYRKKEYKQKKERLKKDVVFRLRCSITCLIRNSIINKRTNEEVKKTKTTDILGCSVTKFKEYIENQFIDGMSWDNYGKWHLDHIVPVSLGLNQDEIIELCYFENYRPAWKTENLSKGTKLIFDLISEENKIRYSEYIDRYFNNKLL